MPEAIPAAPAVLCRLPYRREEIPTLNAVNVVYHHDTVQSIDDQRSTRYERSLRVKGVGTLRFSEARLQFVVPLSDQIGEAIQRFETGIRLASYARHLQGGEREITCAVSPEITLGIVEGASPARTYAIFRKQEAEIAADFDEQSFSVLRRALAGHI